MYWLLQSVYYLMVHTICDIIFYVLVDVVVKLSLKDASEESEKRTIWLWESFLLLLVSLGIYMFHHTPYVLFTLGFATLVYTQLLGRINFRYWWWQFETRWDEFEQHHDSMEAYHSRQSQASMTPVSPPVSRPVYTQPNMGMSVVPSPMSYEMGQRPEVMVSQPLPQYEAWYPSDGDRAGGMRPPAPYPHIAMSEPQMMPPQIPPGQMRFRPPMGPPTPQFYPQQMAQMQRFAPQVLPRAELARKPIHSYLATPPKKAQPVAETGLSKIKSSVMSAFGMTPNHSNLPPGLKNNGQNLCFMNSVLQCLAHSPTLVDCLVHDSQHARCTSAQHAVLDIVTELIATLNVPPGHSDTSAVDSQRLRMVLSSVPGSVVADPYGNTEQSQQDAAEFFMRLLDTLHSALNTQKNDENINHFAQGRQQQVGRLPVMRYAAMTLNMLKFIYGDLTSQRIAELKTACRNEIEQANGLESESYAEPIQRLSDLEWLTYKEANSSVIDDMFTGQLVESQHCVACNRISVGIQTFNILPVPVVEPRQINGLVCLEDCFTKFGNVEDLFGPDGLQCECCNKAVVAADGIGTPGRPQGTPRQPQGTPGRGRVTLPDATPLAASPILVNGGNGAKRGNMDLRRRRAQVASSDSAIYSASSPLRVDPSATPMSPIPVALGGDVFSDSGYNDNQFRTSTPIGTALPVRLTDGQRRSLLRQLPECLIVQLMRFSVLNGKPRKVQRAVSIPVAKLDLTSLIIDNVMRREDLTAINACFQYNLYGLCVHLGSETTGQGHYISYSLASNGKWYKFDDDRVTPVNINYEVNTRQVRENAYLLFYHRSEVNQGAV